MGGLFCNTALQTGHLGFAKNPDNPAAIKPNASNPTNTPAIASSFPMV
jgi:hypothetical protein